MALLAVALAAMVSAVIAVTLDDEADWTLFVWYYPLMAVAGGLLVGALISFRRLHIQVDEDAVRFRFGVFGKSPLANVRAASRRSTMANVAAGNRFAWREGLGMPGVPEGVEITVAEVSGATVLRFFPFPELRRKL
jgi:hypothetical protein